MTIMWLNEHAVVWWRDDTPDVGESRVLARGLGRTKKGVCQVRAQSAESAERMVSTGMGSGGLPAERVQGRSAGGKTQGEPCWRLYSLRFMLR